jgi:4-hydroxybenzoyl-CoA thioesterase/acyl-CoA thioester hydrolase
MARFEPLRLSDLPDGVWRSRILVRFGACDPAGIVYTPEYLNLFNGVVEDWYGEALGISYHDLVGKRRIGLGYAHVSADFAKPSSMGDVLDVALIVHHVGRASLTFTVHAFNRGIERVRSMFVTVTTSLADRKAIALPDDPRGALNAYQSRCQNAADIVKSRRQEFPPGAPDHAAVT